MKQMIYLTLAAGLIMSTGCKREDDGSTEMMNTEEVAEKTREVAVQATEKATEITAKAETATKEVTRKAEAAVSALTVKAEDVMGDLNQSVSQIKQQVAGFDSAQVIAYAKQYKDLMLEKKDEIAALTDQLKKIPLTEMMGEKAKELKTKAEEYTAQLSGLKDRYSVYLDKLKELGIDLSDYGL